MCAALQPLPRGRGKEFGSLGVVSSGILGLWYNVIWLPGKCWSCSHSQLISVCHNSIAGFSLRPSLLTQPCSGSHWCCRCPLTLLSTGHSCQLHCHCFPSGAAGISASHPCHRQTMSWVEKPNIRASFPDFKLYCTTWFPLM